MDHERECCCARMHSCVFAHLAVCWKWNHPHPIHCIGDVMMSHSSRPTSHGGRFKRLDVRGCDFVGRGGRGTGARDGCDAQVCVLLGCECE